MSDPWLLIIGIGIIVAGGWIWRRWRGRNTDSESTDTE